MGLPSVGSEHILLGLLRESEGVAGRALQALGVELSKAREVVKALVAAEEEPKRQEIGLSPEGKQVIQLAVDEARKLHPGYIGTEHLLLGLIRLPESVAVHVLHELGVEEQTVRTHTLQLVSPANQPERPYEATITLAEARDSFKSAGKSDAFALFNEDARRALQLAQEEAQRFLHNYIGTEHLLLGLIRQEESTAGQVLGRLGIELLKVRSAVEFIIGRGDRVVLGEVGLTPRAKQVIELAADEARQAGHTYVGSEHILLGLVREGQGIAAGVLESLGVKLERVRAVTLQVSGMENKLEHVLGMYIRGEKAPGERVSSVQDADDLVPEPSSAEDQGNIVTLRARRVLARAHDEALSYAQTRVGTEHVLLALVREQNGLAFHILSNQGIAIERIVNAAKFLIVEEKLSEPGDEDGVTSDCKKAIALAVDEAWQMRHAVIGTEHLLLGLLRSEGIASGILITRGLTLDKARSELRRLMSQ